MAFPAKDGKKFSMASRRNAHDRAGAVKESRGMSVNLDKSPADVLEPPEGAEPEQDGAEIAQQHGPAMEVNLQHDHEGGTHHVHSVHPDGHEHHSDHGSAEEAHEHGKKLAGVGAEEEPESEPEMETEGEGM
ncbi:MAG: hypothetical protein RB191_18620 [Terriglobia bacterium]|nr:hypothetical protein [Terriglobia bacterium]